MNDSKAPEPVSGTPTVLKAIFVAFIRDLKALYREELAQGGGVSRDRFKSILKVVSAVLVGVVFLVGGFSLVLGALTQIVGAIAMKLGVALVPALVIGFFTIGLGVMAAGAFLAKAGVKKWKAIDFESVDE